MAREPEFHSGALQAADSSGGLLSLRVVLGEAETRRLATGSQSKRLRSRTIRRRSPPPLRDRRREQPPTSSCRLPVVHHEMLANLDKARTCRCLCARNKLSKLVAGPQRPVVEIAPRQRLF